MDFLKQSFDVNINSFGTYSAIIVLIFFLVLFSVISVYVQSHRILTMSILLNLVMILYLICFLFLVNATSENSVFVLTRMLYIVFLLFSISTVLVTDIISKKKRFSATYITFFIGILILVLLLGSDFLIITREVQYGSYMSSVKGPLFIFFQVYVFFISLYLIFDIVSLFIKQRHLFDEVWILYLAMIFYAFYTNFLSIMIAKNIFYKPSLYVNSIVFSLLLIYYVFRRVKQNITEHEEYYEAYLYDELTGVYTRSYALEVLRDLTQQLHLDNHYVAILDIDKFKQINDTFGHHTGDHVLSILGKLLTQLSKESALCGRLGGDEFIIIFMDVNKEKLIQLLNDLRKDYKFEINRLNPDILRTMTDLSIGYILFDQTMTEKEILSEADQAMYAEKAERIDA